MPDNTIVIVNGSTIQIDKPCDRVYLTNFYNHNADKTIMELDRIAHEHSLKKIIAQIPSYSKEAFLNNGYKVEANIPGFFKNETDVYFMGKFLAKERETCHNKELVSKVLEKALFKSDNSQNCYLESSFHLKRVEKSDVNSLINLYKKVFESYPAPIFDAQYILKTMEKGSDYLGIFKDSQIVATAVAEKDFLAKNAEMSAIAVLPEFRGKNFVQCLIEELERILKEQDIKTAYAIARAGSFGINTAFAKMKYTYVGTLVNNTCFGKDLEHMNVWYKKVRRET